MHNHSGASELELMQARVRWIPEDWSFRRIGDTFRICNSLRRPISEEERLKNPGPFPYYGPTKVQGYIGTFEQDGDYALIGEDGDHFLKYKDAPMTQLVGGKCTVNNHAHIVGGTETATREWFYYYFMHRDIFSFLSRQGAGRFKLNKASLEQIPLLVPPLPEQKKIAEILSTWDDAIAANEDLLANSRLRKKALMQKLLTGKTRLPGFGGEWIQRPLGSLLVEVKRPVAWSDDSYYRLLSVKRRSGGVVLREVLHGTKILTKKMNVARTGDYLISKMQVVHGASGAVPSRFDGHHISDSYIALTAKLVDVLDMGFFSWYGKQKIMYHKALLSSYGVHIEKMTFSLNDFMKQKITIPPCVKEQKSIAAVLSAAEEEIEALEQRIDNLKTQKKALMQQLLTGKKRVKVDQIAA